MQALQEFSIPFKGLKTGMHTYHFEVDDRFFSQFEFSKIREGKFQVDLDLDKRPEMMVFLLRFEGNLKAECDRCLNNIDVPMKGDHRVMVKISQETISEDEMESISPVQSTINVSGYVYEMIHLHLPLRMIRDCEGENFRYCNRKILDSIQEQNITESTKSVWEELKKLKW